MLAMLIRLNKIFKFCSWLLFAISLSILDPNTNSHLGLGLELDSANRAVCREARAEDDEKQTMIAPSDSGKEGVRRVPHILMSKR